MSRLSLSLLIVFLGAQASFGSEVEFRIIDIDPSICPHMIIKRTDVNEGRFFYIPRVTYARDRFNRSYLFDIWDQLNGDRVYSFKFSFLTLDDVDYAAEVFSQQCHKDRLMQNLRDRGEINLNTPDAELKNYYPGPIIPSAIQIRLPTPYQPYVVETPNSVLENDIITYIGANPVSLLVQIPPQEQQNFDSALTSHGGIPIGIRIQFSTRMLLGFLTLALDIKDVYTWVDAGLNSGAAIPYVEVQAAMEYAFQDSKINYQITSVGDVGNDELGLGQIKELVDKLLMNRLAQEFGTNDPNATLPGGIGAGMVPQFFVFNITGHHKETSHQINFQLTRLSGDEVDQWALIPYDLSIHSSELEGIHQIMVEHGNFGDNSQFSHINVKAGDLIRLNIFGAWDKEPLRKVEDLWLTPDMFGGPALDSNDYTDSNTEIIETRFIGQVPRIWEYLREDGGRDSAGEIYERYGTSSWFFWLGFNHYKKFKIRKFTYADPDADRDENFYFRPIDIQARYGEPWLIPLGIRIGSGNLITLRDYVRGREDELEYHYDDKINVISFRSDRNGSLYFGNLEKPQKRKRTLRQFFTVVFNGMWERLFGSDTIGREEPHPEYTYKSDIDFRSVLALKVQALEKGKEDMTPYERNFDRQHEFYNGEPPPGSGTPEPTPPPGDFQPEE